MKQKLIIITVSLAILLVGCILTAGCISAEINTGANATKTDNSSIIGTWISEGTYNTDKVTFNQKYTFNADKSGTLSAVKTDDGEIITTIPVIWAYDESQKAYMAYTPNTGDYDYLILSEDGTNIVSEYGEIYLKL